MLTLLGSPRRCCDGLTRRETLRAGGLALLGGLNLPNLLAAEAQARTNAAARIRPGKAKSVIVLYLLGGAPTQDMWDLKPHAPADIRGEFQPIATSAPGIEISEPLPLSARWMHHAAIVRTVNHKAGCHNPLPSYTGYEGTLDNLVASKDSYPPSMGSVCEHLGLGTRGQPAYVYMPCYLGWGQSIRRPGPYAGFLGKECDPLFTECEPYVDNPPDTPYHAQPLRGHPRLPNGTLPDEITIDRLNTRRRLLDQIDDSVRHLDAAGGVAHFDRHRQRAFDIVTSPEVKAVFDLQSEDPKLRDRYGRTLFGQCALIARRLVETGVRFVNVTWDCYWERLKLQFECWDLHERNCAILRDYNLPYFDLTFSALMEDLHDRGLLDETLVVVMSDMGRTPKINARAGRDHWTYCYSVLLAGAGIRGGTVYGQSDSQAAFVKDRPVSTGDICATIYECLGIDPAMVVHDRNRPMEIAHGGRPIRDILAG
ncbi:MAG: DUF1501 domain-containing protein [Planctomycetia bacterium]|nr:DUF1501 domain-containing protein [Planctomycetia bacterium]